MKLKKTLLILGMLPLVSCGGGGNNTEDNKTNSENPMISENQQESEIEETGWRKDKCLKVLTIGNSFSDDCMEYVGNIASSLGIEQFVLGNLYIGACTLATHANNAKYDGPKYEYRLNTGKGWTNTPNYLLSDAITSEDWDFISLQQSSGISGEPSSYTEPLAYLIDYLNALKSDSTQIVWNMTWAFQQNSTHKDFSKYNSDQMTMYRAIVNAVKQEVVPYEDISIIIPVGSAIQDARTSFVGDTLTRDGYHLSYTMGRYVAGLTFIRALTGLSIDDVSYCPSGVSPQYKKVAIESANNAVTTPFDVTTSKYTSL